MASHLVMWFYGSTPACTYLCLTAALQTSPASVVWMSGWMLSRWASTRRTLPLRASAPSMLFPKWLWSKFLWNQLSQEHHTPFTRTITPIWFAKTTTTSLECVTLLAFIWRDILNALINTFIWTYMNGLNIHPLTIEHMYTCSFMHLSNLPIMWLQNIA